MTKATSTKAVKTVKSAKAVETKELEQAVVVEATSTKKNTTRMVLEVPSDKVQSFKVLCDLLGVTQGALVGKALDKYLNDNKALVDQFIELRTQVGKSIN